MRCRVIDLLRHGDAEGGACFRGRRDDPLSREGWTQLDAATASERQGAAQPWGRILCSPSLRCSAYAQALGGSLGLAVVERRAFRERDFGAWEGLRADQISLEDLSAFWADPQGFSPPKSEPFSTFRERVLKGWREIADPQDDGDHCLLITHGGVIRVILGEVLGVDPERLILLEVPPACRSRVRIPSGEGRASLVAHGDPTAGPC